MCKIGNLLRNKHNIAVLSPTLNPDKFTNFIVRKEYDDGEFPKELFLPNVKYGGRVFTNNEYSELEYDIEHTIPDMHLYDKHIKYFGKKKDEEKQIKRILNCAHMRIAPDSKNILPIEELNKYLENKENGIFLHDYDLASLDCCDFLYEFQNQRKFLCKEGSNPYPIGNKYPINIYNSIELEKWLNITTIPNAFSLEHYGLMEDEVMYHLCLANRRLARQVYYNVTYGCKSEIDFLENRLPKILIQTLYLRRSGLKILLTYEDNFFKTKELEQIIKLFNCWLSFQWQENFLPSRQSLYDFCRSAVKFKYTSWAFKTVTLEIDEIRNIFQYIRVNNYELFKMFYEIDLIKFKGGRFVDGWKTD